MPSWYIPLHRPHISLHVPFTTLDIGSCSHNETCRAVAEGLARGEYLLGILKVASGYVYKHRRESSWFYRMHEVSSSITQV